MQYQLQSDSYEIWHLINSESNIKIHGFSNQPGLKRHSILAFNCLFSSTIELNNSFYLVLVFFAASRLWIIVWRLLNTIPSSYDILVFYYFNYIWAFSSSTWSCFDASSRIQRIFFCLSATDFITSNYFSNTSFSYFKFSIWSYKLSHFF